MAPRARIAVVQGAAGRPRTRPPRAARDRRPRRRDRPGRRRRRRRDQLLDQRARSTNFPDPVEVSFLFAARRGRVRRGLGRQQRPDDQHGRAPEPVAHRPWPRHAQPRRPRLGHARQRRDVHRRVRRRLRSVRSRWSTRRRWARRRDAAKVALLLRGRGQRRHAGPRPGEGRRARSSSATAASTAASNKSLAVQQAGGVGMILVNTSPNSLNADFHFVPTVHLADTARAASKAYAAHGRRDGDDQRRRRSSSTRPRRSRRRSRRAARCSPAAATC